MQGSHGLRQLIQVHLRGAFGPNTTHDCRHCGPLPQDLEASLHLLVICPHHEVARTAMMDELFALADPNRHHALQDSWNSVKDNPLAAFYLLVTPSLANYMPKDGIQQALRIVSSFLAQILSP